MSTNPDVVIVATRQTEVVLLTEIQSLANLVKQFTTIRLELTAQ